MYLQKVLSKKTYFLLLSSRQWRKKQDPDPNPYVSGAKMSQIHNTGRSMYRTAELVNYIQGHIIKIKPTKRVFTSREIKNLYKWIKTSVLDPHGSCIYLHVTPGPAQDLAINFLWVKVCISSFPFFKIYLCKNLIPVWVHFKSSKNNLIIPKTF